MGKEKLFVHPKRVKLFTQTVTTSNLINSHIILLRHHKNMPSQLSIDLDKLKKEQLVQFIESLYGFDEQMNNRIDMLISSHDEKKLAALIKKSIASLKRKKSFVEYRDSFKLGQEVEQISHEIMTQLLPISAKLAAELLEKLMATGPNSIERCDDSGGGVGDAYQECAVLWLQAAAQTSDEDKKQSSSWIKKIKEFAANNDYALHDNLLPNVNILLSQDEMRQLAFYYETELRRHCDKETEEDHQWSTLKTRVNLDAVAHALKDAELLERSLLSTSANPNSLQLTSLIKSCIEFGDSGRALKWLQKHDDISPSWLIFTIKSYVELGENSNLFSLCEQLMQVQPNFESFKLVAKTFPDQIEHWQLQANELITKLGISEQLELLLSLQQFDQALSLALENINQLEQTFYLTLLYLLGLVPEGDKKEGAEITYALLRVIFYRCLLSDLLSRAYSKAYHYGVDYLKQLRKLDIFLKVYQSLDNHEAFETHLRTKHGRKRSFWKLLD